MKLLKGAVDRKAWRSVMDYWLYREGVADRIGSENAYLYVLPDFPRASNADD